MQIEALAAVVFTSPDPDRLAAFYRTHLGIPFEHEHHGPIQDHLEAMVGGLQLAIRKGKGNDDSRGAVAPTFRVKEIARFVTALFDAGVKSLHKIADIGEGKQLASFHDPDGNVFRLIQIH